MIFLTVLIVAISVSIAVCGFSLYYGISPMPTSRRVKVALLRALPPDFRGSIYELGAGWGTLAIPLARRYPECRVVAIEGSPIAWLILALRKRVAGLPNLEIILGDFFKYELDRGALVVCYLYPGAMGRLAPLVKESALVATHTFALPGAEPSQVIEVPDLYRTKIYLYSRVL